MKLRIATIGKEKAGVFAPAIEEYQRRLGRYCRFSSVELPASRRSGEPARAEEASALLELRQPREKVVALDE